MIDDPLEDDRQEAKQPRRYDPEHHKAWCKYCYTTHQRWIFMGEFWECQLCEHGTADEYMQIEGVEMSPEQQAFYLQ
jgi:hypothetical protein